MCRDSQQNTPLHLAASEGHFQVVSFFIEELKCPPNIIGACKLTPLQMAIVRRNPKIAQYLHERSVIPYILIGIDMINRRAKA